MPNLRHNTSLVDHLASLSLPETEARLIKRKLAALTKIAATRPQDLLPHVEDVAKLMDSASGVVREGSLETLMLVSRAAPGAMAFLLPKLHTLLANDPQNVVADRVIEILTNYAKTSKSAARKVVPIFASTIDLLGVRSAARILNGLGQVVREVPGLAHSALRIGQKFERSVAKSVRGAAVKLLSIAAG